LLKIKCTKKGYTKKVSRDEYMQQTKDLKRCDSDILVTREKLAQLLQKGYAVILAEFNKYNSINIDNIKGVQLLALDVDESKKITMKEMIKKLEEDLNITPVIAYCTFSDTDNTRFRLIYRLAKTLSSKEYTAAYKEFVKRYGDFIDNQPINANRIWQGTNKKVYVNKQDKAITKELIEEFIKATNKKNKHLSKEIIYSHSIRRNIHKFSQYNVHSTPLQDETAIFNAIQKRDKQDIKNRDVKRRTQKSPPFRISSIKPYLVRDLKP